MIHETSKATAKFGAMVKPLADGAPFGPGSDRSHDREGVVFSKIRDCMYETEYLVGDGDVMIARRDS